MISNMNEHLTICLSMETDTDYNKRNYRMSSKAKKRISEIFRQFSNFKMF